MLFNFTRLLLVCCCFTWLITIPTTTYSQNQFSFDFNGCQLSDGTNSLNDLLPNSTLLCDCGVEGDGLSCDGANVFYEFQNDLKSLFELPEYTLEFSFLGRNTGQVQALFTIMNDCNRDSIFTLQYIPQDNEVELTISRIVGDSWDSRGSTNPDRCWHTVAVTKTNSIYALYVDETFVESFDNIIPFPIHPNATPYLGFSPCVTIGSDNTFNGIIDNVRFSSFAKTGNDFTSSSLSPDLILNNDTTIVLGNTVSIFSGNTCSTDVSWSPIDGIDDITAIEPEITPSESTTYFRTLTHSGCTTVDSVRINTFNPEDLDCTNLLMPNIFTPNSDNVNDTYGIANGFIIEELKSFEIFSRWGEKLYSTDQKTEKWDGTYQNNPAMNGMYIYIVDYTCGAEEYTKKGSFGLMR